MTTPPAPAVQPPVADGSTSSSWPIREGRRRWRLLDGMVRVNRPWLLFTGLSQALAGMVATAAFGLISSDIWRVTHYVRPLRDEVFTLLSITALVGWLVVDHELWDRPRDEISGSRRACSTSSP
ncbi:hypothetical protein [Streptomyces sp. NPDC057460]|uniref:hypothetical protein n=1 Tax=Streptomyces sp. NPDC057460 TaxID=3346141 RepID=UPI0036918360